MPDSTAHCLTRRVQYVTHIRGITVSTLASSRSRVQRFRRRVGKDAVLSSSVTNDEDRHTKGRLDTNSYVPNNQEPRCQARPDPDPI